MMSAESWTRAIIIWFAAVVTKCASELRPSEGNVTNHEQLVDRVKMTLDRSVSETVWNALRKIDRISFMNEEFVQDWLSPNPIHVGYGYYSESLDLAAVIISVLEPYLTQPQSLILEVGGGSSYLTVCMTELLHKKSSIFSLEINLKLLNASIKKVEQYYRTKSAETKSKNVKRLWWNGRKGYFARSPYNAIYFSGLIDDHDFNKVMYQVKPGGILLSYDWVHDSKKQKTLWLKKWEKINDYDIQSSNIFQCPHYYRELMKSKSLFKFNDIMGQYMRDTHFDKHAQVHVRSDEFFYSQEETVAHHTTEHSLPTDRAVLHELYENN